MLSLAAAAVLHVSLLATGADTYADAHRINAETGRPLLVLVGADWCPACQQMSRSVVPQLERQGLLSKVAFAKVNTDREHTLAGKLMSGGSIPQLIMYQRTNEGWRRRLLTGAQSAETVTAFVNREIEAAGRSSTPVKQPSTPVSAVGAM